MWTWGIAIATQQAVAVTHSRPWAWARLSPKGRSEGTGAPSRVGAVCGAGDLARIAIASKTIVVKLNRPSPT